jgi:EAL domain-containing protein (putative c-di-GMP-specific phosphodiesterase class I)
MQKADMAMYFSKSEGGSRFCFYTENMNQITTDRMTIENSLRQAIENNELRLFFQPLVTKTGHVAGAEALIRWIHPKLGLLSPDKFIPIAEESSIIIDIGNWVIIEACKSLKRWNNLGYLNIVMSVNVSAMEFTQEQFASKIIQSVTKSGITPSHLELEITESVAMKKPENVLIIMNELKAKGMRISIDDFGTGYSSLSYLAKFPVDRLKIDHTFIRDIENDPTVLAITLATISLAKQLGKQIVVEGIENINQADLLFKYDTDFQQGFYYSRPVPEEQFLQFLKDRNSAN